MRFDYQSGEDAIRYERTESPEKMLHACHNYFANPPFNDSDGCSGLLREDRRWAFGVPFVGNANFLRVPQFIHYMAQLALKAAQAPAFDGREWSLR